MWRERLPCCCSFVLWKWSWAEKVWQLCTDWVSLVCFRIAWPADCSHTAARNLVRLQRTDLWDTAGDRGLEHWRPRQHFISNCTEVQTKFRLTSLCFIVFEIYFEWYFVLNWVVIWKSKPKVFILTTFLCMFFGFLPNKQKYL